MYGSILRRVTWKPRASSSDPMEAAASPLPRDETTPPVTKMNFGVTGDLLSWSARVSTDPGRRAHPPVSARARRASSLSRRTAPARRAAPAGRPPPSRRLPWTGAARPAPERPRLAESRGARARGPIRGVPEPEGAPAEKQGEDPPRIGLLHDELDLAHEALAGHRRIGAEAKGQREGAVKALIGSESEPDDI